MVAASFLLLSLLSSGDSSVKNLLLQITQPEEVIFWHFWGGEDREIVEGVVDRFNQYQNRFRVRAIAMPGNNLQAKLFLSVAGGDPPDLVNQDDPILADWSAKGIVQPLGDIAKLEEIQQLDNWLFPSAKRLSQIDGQYFAVCNGIDIRALYFNQTLLSQHGLQAPTSITELNRIAFSISPPSKDRRPFYAFLPDSRRLWAWGYVFGGDFYDKSVDVNSEPIIDALDWMRSFSQEYGSDNIASFRQGDQSLPGKTFPLLPLADDSMVGRYAMIMDGQWRTRDIERFVERRKKLKIKCPEFGVCPLPCPNGGRQDAGWVNGNFFIVPSGCQCPEGAWEFVKFWIGLEDPQLSAETCAAGGWIPVSKKIVNHSVFQKHLNKNPLFKSFVALASSENQFPIPPVQGGSFFKRRVEQAAYDAMFQSTKGSDSILRSANLQIQEHIDRLTTDRN